MKSEINEVKRKMVDVADKFKELILWGEENIINHCLKSTILGASFTSQNTDILVCFKVPKYWCTFSLCVCDFRIDLGFYETSPKLKLLFISILNLLSAFFGYCLILGILFQTYRFQSDVRRLFIWVEPPNKESQEEPSLWGREGKSAK